jgi:D-inositol-3-phosphate glycosyltransferase
MKSTSTPLNIAMLSFHTCPLATLGGKDTGGMNVYVRDLTTFLGQRGIHVDVFTRSQDEHVPHILHDLGYGNRVVHIPAGPEVPIPKPDLPAHLPQFVQGIKAFAASKSIKYDLIHSHYWLSGIAGLSLKDDWKVPMVQMFHTLGRMKNQIAQSESERESPQRIEGEELLLSYSDCLVVSTPAEIRQIEQMYTHKPALIRIIPPGVDITRFYPIPTDEARQVIGVPTGSCMLLFVGRIEPLKGIDTLIRAIALMGTKLKENTCPHYLVIIGGDPNQSPDRLSAEMQRLKTLCHTLGVDDLVIFLGKRNQDTLPYYYSSAEVVIVPSHYESFGMVALEAMACGIPVVASQVGGLAYLVKDGKTGFSIPGGDPELLAEKLSELIGDHALRKRMGAQAATYAKAYRWENIAHKIAALYSDLLKK